MAILIASTLLETETEAWYSFYVDTMEDVKGLPTSKSTGSSYKVKKFASILHRNGSTVRFGWS